MTLEGATGSRPRGGGGLQRYHPPCQTQPAQSRHSQRTKWALSEGLPRHMPSSKPDHRLSTDGFVEIVLNWALESTYRGDKRRFLSQFKTLKALVTWAIVWTSQSLFCLYTVLYSPRVYNDVCLHRSSSSHKCDGDVTIDVCLYYRLLITLSPDLLTIPTLHWYTQEFMWSV